MGRFGTVLQTVLSADCVQRNIHMFCSLLYLDNLLKKSVEIQEAFYDNNINNLESGQCLNKEGKPRY